jgi:hypothetical protein
MLDDFKGTVFKKKSNKGKICKNWHIKGRTYEYLFLSEESMKYCPSLVNLDQSK